MKDSTTIIHAALDITKPSIIIETSWWFLILVLIILLLLLILRNRIKNRIKDWYTSETSFEINTGLITYNQNIKRSYQNLYIANRIYIELVTRKAAIPIDKKKDVINEVYDSWYVLFETIRDEIKNLSGEFLVNNKSTKNLIEITIKILNDGLRPHLTEFQADFRKWYDKELTLQKNDALSPQEIQKNFPRYEQLMESMLLVNQTLKVYSEQLKALIDNN